MQALLDLVHSKLEAVDSVLWHPYFMVAALLATGLYLTGRLVVPQIRCFGHAVAIAAGRRGRDGGKGGFSHVEALSSSLAATLGVGSIAGVATAIHLGGPGAVFWLWVSGFLGMALKLTEVSLASQHRSVQPDGGVVGGPMFTIVNALGSRWKPLAYVFAAFALLVATFGTGSTIQSNTVAVNLESAFGVPRWVAGIAFAALLAPAIFAGIGRLARVTTIVVPCMAVVYLACALVVVAMNASALPGVFRLIIDSAFGPAAAVGGFVGTAATAAVRYGLARGVFANEAGLGSAPIIHSAARSDTPLRAGLVAMLGPFVDTLVVCTLTAMVILGTGVWKDKIQATIPLSHVRIMNGPAETREQREDPDLLLSGPMSFVGGVALGGFSVFHDRSVMEAPKILLAGKPFNGTIDFGKGKPVLSQVPREDEDVPPGLQPRKRKLSPSEMDGLSIRGYFCQTGAVLTAASFERSLGLLGKLMVALGVLVFGFTACTAWSACGDRVASFLMGRRAILPNRIVFLAMVLAGSVLSLDVVWTLGDILNALMMLPSLLSLWLLAGFTGKMLKGFSPGKGASGRDNARR